MLLVDRIERPGVERVLVGPAWHISPGHQLIAFPDHGQIDVILIQNGVTDRGRLKPASPAFARPSVIEEHLGYVGKPAIAASLKLRRSLRIYGSHHYAHIKNPNSYGCCCPWKFAAGPKMHQPRHRPRLWDHLENWHC